VTLLAIDPGSNIGWALFSLANGEEIGRGVMRFPQFAHSLHYKPQQDVAKLAFTTRSNTARPQYAVKKVVYESWYTNPDMSLGGSTGVASEVIGVLKYLCHQADITPVAQRSAILRPTSLHARYEWPRTKTGNEKHLPDEDAAYLHGFHYLVSNGILRPNQDELRKTL
jgi:hypothetical protein